MSEKKRKRLSKRLKEEAFDMECDDGQVRTYTVRELAGTQRDEYMESRKENFNHDKDGNVTGIKTMKGMIANLLKHCVYDDTGKVVSAEEIERWPISTQQELFQMALEVSNVMPKKEEAGEDKNPTPPSDGGGSA